MFASPELSVSTRLPSSGRPSIVPAPGLTSVVPYVLLGAALWVSLHESGVNRTLAGVALRRVATAVPLRRSPMAGTAARQILRGADGPVRRRLHLARSWAHECRSPRLGEGAGS